MISIRKYLYLKSPAVELEEAPEADEFQVSLAQLAAATLAEIAVECGPPGSGGDDGPPSAISGLRDRLENASSAAEIDALRAELPRLLADLRREKREQERRQTTEVQKMVQMLQQTIEALTRGNQRSVERLRIIESDVRAASQISEIVALKERLRSCVEQIRGSAEAEQQEFASAKARLEQDLLSVQESISLARGGVPGRADAERRLREEGESAVVLVISLDRYPAIKSRYGAPAGERYFSAFLDEVTARLPSPKKVFRWNERTLLVEAAAEAFSGAIEVDIRNRLSGIPPTAQVDVGGRLALLDNLHRWVMVPPHLRSAEVFERIEAFASL